MPLLAVDEGLFDELWNRPEQWVEEPNRRRGGTSGVIRATLDGQPVFIKKQIGHYRRSLLHPFGQPTALVEQRALRRVSRLGIETPDVVYCDSRIVRGEHRTLLVTRALEGYRPLSDPLFREQPTVAGDPALIAAVAGTLARLHRNRYQHTALFPSHVFVKATVYGYRVALLDLEKLRRRLTTQKASRHDLRQFLRRQRLWEDDKLRLFLSAYRNALQGATGEDAPEASAG
jgi:tRNA A-37 threonylcarbamoyl transferase component Bud32